MKHLDQYGRFDPVSQASPRASAVVDGTEKGTTDRSSKMTGSEKAYSAPRLETLSLRETRDIDVNIGASVHIHLPTGGLLS
jgi:hypothetical protein